MQILQNFPDSIKQEILSNSTTPSQKLHTGFLAQEVEQICQDLNYSFSGLHVPENETDNYSLAYGSFVPLLVKAVQELNQKVESLVRENNGLKKSNAEQDNVHKIVRDQQAQIDSQQKEIDGLKAFMQEIQKQVNAYRQHETK